MKLDKLWVTDQDPSRAVELPGIGGLGKCRRVLWIGFIEHLTKRSNRISAKALK